VPARLSRPGRGEGLHLGHDSVELTKKVRVGRRVVPERRHEGAVVGERLPARHAEAGVDRVAGATEIGHDRAGVVELVGSRHEQDRGVSVGKAGGVGHLGLEAVGAVALLGLRAALDDPEHLVV